MARFSCSLALALVLSMSGGALRSFAQAPADVKPPITADSARPIDQKKSTPTKLQTLEKALSGKWLLTVKFEPMPQVPTGVPGRGEESWREGPGGYTFIEEEQIPTPGGQAYLLGVLWWDAKLKRLQGMECNNQAPSTCDLKGALTDITVTWDGKTFAIDENETHDGKKTVWHEAWSDITPTSFTQTGDVTQPDGSTTRFFTIRGTRAKE